jgi:hypothetical protein
MNHEAYENEMINGVNLHGRVSDEITFDNEDTDTVKSVPVKHTGLKTLGRGLGRVALALFTAATFGFSVFDFIAVAYSTGYLAVALFICGIIMLAVAFILLYAQGITDKERPGESK